MTVAFFCPRWGSEGLPWDEFLGKAKAAGYEGVEWGIPHDTETRVLDEVSNLALKQGLQLIAQHYDTSYTDFAQHYDAFAAWLEKIRAYPWTKINSQTGKDHFPFEWNLALIRLAGDIVHETHRGKCSFAAHVTRDYLDAIKDLKLTLDISHWVNTAESFLEDQQQAVQSALERTEHIHARVGYTEGPQVPDPRAPEWQFAVTQHLSWWDRVVARKRQENDDAVLTITPEFGPYPYLVHLPHTRQAIGDQWEMNCYMMNLLRKRYS
jgi:sugar phosphate isomerase/epimerase